MTNFTNCTIIVLAEDRTKAQDVTTTEYFNAQASSDGHLPVTHYFTSGPFNNDEVDALVNTPWPKWVRSDDWQSALAGLGLVQVIPEIDPSVVLTVPAEEAI
jgi:hypothetical protein